jgi:hypothetical protein
MGKKKAGEPKENPQAHPSPQYHSFSQVYENARKLEGEQITPLDLLTSGKKFIIHRFFKHTSQFGGKPYVSVQIEIDGGMRYFNSASVPIMDQLERTSSAFPYSAKLGEKVSATGKKYTTLA